MIDLLHKITEGGIALDIVDGQLKLYAKAKEVDPQLLAEIKENKEQILAYLLDTGALDKNTAVLQPIVPVAQAENYALSFGQQRLWTLSQFESGASTYNMPYHIELKGQYDLIYLKQAIRAVIDRHEILRTVFKTNEIGEVRQYIIPSEDFEFNVTYIDYRNASDKEQEVQDYITNDASKSFDLETGPLFRVGLLQTDDNRYTFYYNLHHIISDGWSMNILSQDVLHYYKAYANNAAVALEPLKIQYKDFANWQLEHLNSESSTLSKEYWAKELSGDLPVLDLPSEIVRPTVLSYEGRGYRTYFSKELSKRIKDFSTENGGSLFTGLLAAWNVLFHKYSGEQDILIGSPNAGRDHADVFNQIGFYVNTMVLRNTIDPEMTFRSLYKQVKDRTLESYKHQTYPFDRIIEDLNIQRNVGRNAIFDVLLVLQNAGIQISDADLENIEVSEIRELGVKAAKFDVELSFVEAGSYLAFDLTYNTAVYDEGSMKRMISHYQQLWEELLDNLDTPVTDISYISEKEEQQLLIDFNKTTAPYPDTLSIPEVFEKRVQESPDAVAVVYEDQSFTYLELDDLSNKFAQFIQDQYTIASNDTIGIKLERNHWFVVALLGVLKAGAVYVPMDPEFPKDVLDFITNDAACIFCITKEELQAFITCKKDIDISDFKLNQTADPLAYIMYTSGSTGKPKGVIINQKSILRLVMNTNYLDVTSHTVLGLSNFSFDGSTFDIFMPLLNGAKLVISEKNIFLDLQKFNELIITKNISCFFITTALFNVIVEAELPALGQIKCILFGGEQVSVKHVKRFKDLYPAVSLRHVYGPTENTTFSTFYEINAISDNPKTIPIGCSITNSTSYILDAKNKLVPIGVPGEICLGGEGIAEGYLNRPDLTETKFVPHPFIDGLSIYKTGDTGKWLSSGDIEFIGRKDDQIKIRGHRIELGEIENALLTIDAIDDAIVIARKNKNDEKEIVAYMVSGVTLSASDLRNELKKKLAIYMLPSYFVQLDQFILNSNGKVNKKLLPDPETVCLSTTSDYVAPRNGKEELLVSIWTAVLQKTTVSVTDNFFELGGHSLKAARLIEEYRRAFNVKLTLETIFLHPILEDHVQLIEESTYSEYQSIPVMDSNDSYALSAGQKRLWALSQLETGASMYNMSFHTILEGSYDIAVLKQAIYATIKRHEILRTVFKIDDSLGELRQYIIPNDSFYLDIPFLNLQGEDGIEDKLAAYRKEDLHLPFDLTNGPLVRACLFQLEEAKYAFHYSMHHIIGDGWSMEVLSKDIFTFYESFKNNTTVSLQPLKIQYKEYANWQRLQLEEASSQQDKVFWKELLNGSLPVLDLPTQKLRPAVKTAQGRRFRTYLSAEQTTAIKGVTQEYGGSLFIALFSGWNILLHKYTAARDIIIGTPVAGRNHIDLLDQIGFYVNTIALRNEVNPELSFVSFYKKIKEQTLKSYNHQMYPFDQLIDDLDIRHQTSRNAVFDIMFSLQNVLSHRVDAIVSKDAVTAIEDTGEAIAKFDLEVNFQEVGQCLLFDVTYNTNVYEAETIEGLMNHYKQLWNVILEQPNELIQNLTYLSQEEEDQLVHTFNNNDIIYPEEDTIVTLFQQQAEKTPHNLAVVFGETQITYAQLDALSDKMANYIRNTNDVHPEDLIAVKLERSDWYVIALLAILKTGAAYVPIDLNYPEDRIAFIQSDSNCIATIDDSFISEFQNATIVSDSRDVMVQASNMAYVIYTSGSTGKPKGVMVEHKALSNLCHWHQKEYSLSTDSRCTLYASIGFDASTWELFPTLLSGGCVYPIPESIRLKTADLIAFFNVHKITQAFVPTVLYNDILRDSATLQQPLKLLLGGEALIVKDVNDKLEIYNNYGPTENAVVSTCYRVKKDTVGLVPIGKPIGNVKTYILDENGSLVPPGVTGELCLAGKSLARGYLNSPSLTGEKFVSHVLAGDGKLYKTGDLAKWLPDGNIQFMGRKDNQVKLRGYRIELGEIEAALQEISGIKETIVLVKEIKGEKYITAYVVGNTEIDRMILKKKLSRTLADYMIPTYFIYVDSMPLTANGKVDVKLLPDTDDIQFKEVAVYVSPESDLEKQLVTIWQDILEKDRIGVEDSFFALGGHSLKAIQVISKIQKEFNIKIELKELYNEPRIKNLASYIESIQILNSQQPVFMAVGEELVF